MHNRTSVPPQTIIISMQKLTPKPRNDSFRIWLCSLLLLIVAGQVWLSSVNIEIADAINRKAYSQKKSLRVRPREALSIVRIYEENETILPQ